MIEVSLGLIISAFVAGLLMFLAPCTLPLVPAYLAFISGVKRADLNDPRTADHARRQIIVNGIFFILGFSLVFVAFGMLAGLFGSQIGQFRGLLAQIGGLFVILFGLMMLNVIKITPLLRERRLAVPDVLKPGNPFSATVIGATFAFGWTPCVGPVLGTVLLLASAQSTVYSGGLLLAIFSLGLSIPFILTAFMYSRATKTIFRLQATTQLVSFIGGVFLIIIGMLLVSENFGLMVQYGNKLFNSLGVGMLFDYL